MAYLLVTEPFAGHPLGEIVINAAVIKQLLASKWQSHVVMVGTDGPAAPLMAAVAVKK